MDRIKKEYKGFARMPSTVKQLISKAMELSPTVREGRLLEGTQLQTARAHYYLRAQVEKPSEQGS